MNFNHLTIRGVFAATSLGLSLPASAVVLLRDEFTTSGPNEDVNFEINRQTGTLAGTTYVQGAGAYPNGSVENGGAASQNTVSGGALWLSGTGSNPHSSISPNHNFIENPGIGGYMSISFDVNPSITLSTGDIWGAISFGASDNANFGDVGAGARGQFINTGSTQHGMLFKDSGEYQVFGGGAGGSFTPDYTSPSRVDSHHYEFRITGLVDGNPWDGSGNALIQVFRDNNPTPFYSFTRSGGYTSNYITLQGYSNPQTIEFDNFQVAIVPETTSVTLFGAGLALALCSRRRAR